MSITDVVTVSDARANLSRILSYLSDAGADADPVFIGAHRRAEGVLLSVKAYDELVAARQQAARAEAVASAMASVEAEGLQPSPQFALDAKEYVRGAIDADEFARRVVSRHQRSQSAAAS